MKRRCGFKSPVECRPLHEVSFTRDAFERRAAHARHEAHVQHDIGAVGDLDAAAREGRFERTHAVGHHIQRPSAHAAGEQGVHLRVSLVRGHPIVVGTRILLVRRADKGEVLDPGDVRGMRARQYAIGEGLRVERQQLLVRNQLSLQGLELGVAAVAPVNLGGLSQLGDFVHPSRDFMIHRGERDVLSCCGHWLSLEEGLIDG